jgi:integrase
VDAERELAAVVGLPASEAVARVWTVRHWLEVWLAGLQDRLRPSTVRAYRSVVHRHLIPLLGTLRVSKLRTKTVQRAVDLIARQHLPDGRLISPGTVRRIAAVLRAALSEARRQGLLGHNPAWRLRLPAGRRPHAVVWNAEREALWRETGVRPKVAVWDVPHLVGFLESVRTDPLFPLWWLIVMRGLRRGEIVALHGEDFDFAGREVSVWKQTMVVDGVQYLGPPKSAAGVRRLALDEATATMLRVHWIGQQRRLAGTGANPDGYMFTHLDGRPIRPDWLGHRFAQLVKRLDLPPVRLHDVRHAHASLAGAAGVPLKVIQHDMGHSSAVTTADTYWSVFQDAGHAAVAATAQLLLSDARVRMSLAAASQA